MNLIAFAGYAGSGKDTAADYLVERYGFCLVKFADVIKLMVGVMLNCSTRKFEDRDWKEKEIDWLPGVTPRILLQTLGTEWGRDMIDHNVWVKATMRRIAGMDRVVISDCRFDNEAVAVSEAGGLVVWIDRPGCGPVNGHKSETALSESLLNDIINNDGGLLQLYRQLDWICEDLRIGQRARVEL